MINRLKKQWKLFVALLLASILFAGASVLSAMYSSWLLDHVSVNETGLFGRMVLFAVAVMAAYLCMYCIYGVVGKLVKNKILEKTREQLFHDIFFQKISDFGKVNTAEYLSQMTNDVKMVEDGFLAPLINVISNILCIIVSAGLIIYYAPIILVIIIISIVIIIFIPSLLGQIYQKKQVSFSEQSVVYTNRIKDFFSGFEVIASAGRKREAELEFQEENKALNKKKLEAETWMEISQSVSQMLGLGIQYAVMLACVWFILRGRMTIGTLFMIVQIMNIFIYPVTGILQAVPQMKGTLPVIKKMESYVQEAKGYNGLELEKRLSLNGLSFSYGDGEPVLKNVNLSIEKGKKYVIVGQSGCGKSTLLKVLSGYFEDYEGEITVDGNTVAKTESARLFSLTAFIHQNVFLFDKSIRENICLYQDYSDSELEAAVKKSGVYKFLNHGITLDSETGENGLKLSGGQRQRIAIARALIQKKPIIMLDEGTSALDPQTAFEIEDDLLRNEEITLLTITHHAQKELMDRYDEVIYMAEGKITDGSSI